MAGMYNPPHPGEIVKGALIEGANMSVTEAAELLGVSRVSLSKLINGRAGISPEMAVRLSIALGTSSEMWMNVQKSYELWQAEKRRGQFKKEVSNIEKFKRHHHRDSR